MATIKEFIEAKLQRFSITLSDVELAVMLTENQITENEAISASNMVKVKKAFVSIIPEVLLLSEVSEGDLTLKWNIEGIKAYYSMLCNELGLEDKLNVQVIIPTVTDRSNLW